MQLEEKHRDLHHEISYYEHILITLYIQVLLQKVQFLGAGASNVACLAMLSFSQCPRVLASFLQPLNGGLLGTIFILYLLTKSAQT